MESLEKEYSYEFESLLKKTHSRDFDGHTEFNRLVPEQKLLWLSQCAHFVAIVNNSEKEI